MKTILITAYAVNPYKGSEDGTGWNITSEIAKEYNVILITRKNNVPHIEKYLNETKELHLNNIQCYGFDLPQRVMKWKKKLGERGYVAYYYLWQYYMPKFIKESGFEFDIAHALNFHSDSQPNFLWKLGRPTFWGPIGHHPKVKREFLLKHYSFGNLIKDSFYSGVKWVLRNLDPNFSKSVKNSTKIFVINSSVASVISAPDGKVVNLPAVASKINVLKLPVKEASESFIVLSVGRFHYMKGFDLVIESFARFIKNIPMKQRQKCNLKLVGKGEEFQNFRKLAVDLGVNQYVIWQDWVDKSDMEQIYKSSDVFLFPSHEGAGMVVPEAMSYGVPVVCFDNYGPGELIGDCGLKVKYSSYQNAVIEFSEHLNTLFTDQDLRKKIRMKSFERFTNEFTWEKKGIEIKKQYKDAS